MRNRILVATGLAITSVFLLAVGVLGQDGSGIVTDPALADLTTVTGLAGILTIILNLGRGLVDASVFDRFAPLFAAVLGVFISIGVALATGGPETGESLIVAGLVGFLAGNLSQNVNTILARAVS